MGSPLAVLLLGVQAPGFCKEPGENLDSNREDVNNTLNWFRSPSSVFSQGKIINDATNKVPQY